MTDVLAYLHSLTLIKDIGHLSYFLVAVSFLLRDILLLRIVAICAASANIAFAYNGAAGPNFIPIFWQSVFICINVTWSFRLIRERAGIRFSEDEKELYDTVFRSFKPLEFMKLMRLAEWRTLPAGELIAHGGVELQHVMLIYNGEAEVRAAHGHRPLLHDGAFVGEMSFLRGGAATADVATTGPTRIVQWPKEALNQLLARNPAMRATLTTVFGQDLANKLAASNEDGGMVVGTR